MTSSRPTDAGRQFYRHYKGGVYEVILCARHTETNEDIIIYCTYGGDRLWARPASMFFGMVDGVNGRYQRFTKIARPTPLKCSGVGKPPERQTQERIQVRLPPYDRRSTVMARGICSGCGHERTLDANLMVREHTVGSGQKPPKIGKNLAETLEKAKKAMKNESS